VLVKVAPDSIIEHACLSVHSKNIRNISMHFMDLSLSIQLMFNKF
jgi:hypothetical protein